MGPGPLRDGVRTYEADASTDWWNPTVQLTGGVVFRAFLQTLLGQPSVLTFLLASGARGHWAPVGGAVVAVVWEWGERWEQLRE